MSTWVPLRAIATALAAAILLVGPPSARASDASLGTTLARWSTQIRFKARGVSLSATRRHPVRMTTKAKGFRRDAIAAQRALRAQRPGTQRGRRAKALAIAAYGDYAVVGREWALSGTARLRHELAVARQHALRASRFARSGNRLLLRAAALLR